MTQTLMSPLLWNCGFSISFPHHHPKLLHVLLCGPPSKELHLTYAIQVYHRFCCSAFTPSWCQDASRRHFFLGFHSVPPKLLQRSEQKWSSVNLPIFCSSFIILFCFDSQVIRAVQLANWSNSKKQRLVCGEWQQLLGNEVLNWMSWYWLGEGEGSWKWEPITSSCHCPINTRSKELFSLASSNSKAVINTTILSWPLLF